MGCQGSDVVFLQVSRGRGLGEYLVESRYRGRPTIYTDRGPWYMKVLGIRHRCEIFGIRNSIEQWFSKLKRRIKQFNIQDKNNRKMDKGMDSLKLTVSF